MQSLGPAKGVTPLAAQPLPGTGFADANGVTCKERAGADKEGNHLRLGHPQPIAPTTQRGRDLCSNAKGVPERRSHTHRPVGENIQEKESVWGNLVHPDIILIFSLRSFGFQARLFSPGPP